MMFVWKKRCNNVQLTQEQLEVVNCDERKILVKAGAGTGKTAVMTKRILRLIDENPNNSIRDMAIITFTNKATEELQSRLKKEFYLKWKQEKDPSEKLRFRYELESLNSAHISTIHVFCKKILEWIGPYYGGDIMYSPAYQVRSDLMSLTLDESIKKWLEIKEQEKKDVEYLKYFPVHRIKEILKKAYSIIRTKGLDIDLIIKSTKRSSYLEMETTKRKLKSELAELLEIIKETHIKLKFDRLDVDDLLEYSCKILKSEPSLAEIVRKKLKYIFVDEFQDTSLYQSDILRILCDDSDNSPHLFVVGDLKQSIYEFRGADPYAYGRMENWIRENGKILTLSINWRSKPEIVYFVNNVFNRIQDTEKYSFKRDPLRPSKDLEKIELFNAYKWILADKNENGIELIADFLYDQIKIKKENAGKFAILVRKNYELEIIKSELDKKDIPSEIIGSGNFYNQKEIVDIYKVLKSLLNMSNPSALLELRDTIFFHNRDNADEVVKEIIENKLIYTYTPSQLIDYIFQRTNIFRRCSTKEKSNLNKLKEISRKLVRDEKLSLYNYVEWLSSMISGNVDEPLADTIGGQENKKVQLMTIHRAKGLEFPVVILPNLDQNISGSSLNPEVVINSKSNSIEFRYEKYYEPDSFIISSGYEETVKETQYNVYSEELRVLYVALTRAKEKLILCGKKNLGKDRICYQNWIRED